MTEAIIKIEGDTWRILSVGMQFDSTVMCHMASTTRFRDQRNGKSPIQELLDVPAKVLEAALDRPRGFFTWSHALRGAFCRGEVDAAAGKVFADCPYADRRKAGGGLTWSRAFRTAWHDGMVYARRSRND